MNPQIEMPFMSESKPAEAPPPSVDTIVASPSNTQEPEVVEPRFTLGAKVPYVLGCTLLASCFGGLEQFKPDLLHAVTFFLRVVFLVAAGIMVLPLHPPKNYDRFEWPLRSMMGGAGFAFAAGGLVPETFMLALYGFILVCIGLEQVWKDVLRRSVKS